MGEYKVHLRLRDLAGRNQASRRTVFRVLGPEIKVLPNLQLTKLSFKNPKTGRKRKGVFFAQGQDVAVEAVIGGMKLVNRPGHKYEVDTALSVYVRNLKGKLLTSDKDLQQITRAFTFPPRRLRLRGIWRVPESVKGWVLLQVEVLDRLSDRVSMRQRRILVRAR
jgi:hypothetical protein